MTTQQDQTVRDSLERARQRRDHDQFWQELSGRDTGRARRFIRKDDSDLARAFKDADAVEFLYFVGMTLGQRITRLHARLAILEEVTAEALEEAERQLLEAERNLDRLEASATVDRYGRRVYRSADGRTAFYDDGRELTPAEIADVEWKPGAPTWETRETARQATDQATQQRDELLDAQRRLRDARERLENDPSPETVRDVEEELEQLPASLREKLEQRTAAMQTASSPAAEAAEADASPTTRSFNRSVLATPESVTARMDQSPGAPSHERGPPDRNQPGGMT